MKKLFLMLACLLLVLNLYGQDNNVALFFFTTDYQLDRNTEFLKFQTNMVKEEMMYTYGFRTSAYQNYSKNNFFNSISNECSADSTSLNKQLFVYISGLSASDESGQVYIQVSESDSLAFDQMIPLTDIAQAIGSCQAQHVLLFMDVPLSAKIGEGITENLFPGDSLSRQELIDRSFKTKSRFYVASSDDKIATVGRSRFSPMTSKLLETLRNYGDGDDVVTMHEMKGYMEALKAIPSMGAFKSSESNSDFLFNVK